MKENWIYRKLGEVATLKNGFAFRSSLFRDAGRPIVRISNIQDDAISTDFVYFDKNDYKENLDKYVVNEGDILIAMSGATTGKVGINKNKYILYLNQRVGKVVPKKELNSRFLFYYLKQNANVSLSVAQGLAQPNLSTQQINSFVIPVPPLSEQERIVSELDLLSGIIEKKKEQLKEYEQLAQAIFYDMFGDPVTNEKGWEVKKMGEVGVFQRGSGIQRKDFVEKGFPCIHYGQLHTSFGAFTKVHISCISKELFDISRIAHKGNLILAITSEDVEGSCKSTAWFGDYDIAVGSDAAIYSHSQNAIYLSYYTMTKAFYYEKQKYANGFKVTHISTKDIASIPIPLPPLSLQQQFAEKIEAIEKQKELIKQSITETETLFNSRMDYYFN